PKRTGLGSNVSGGRSSFHSVLKRAVDAGDRQCIAISLCATTTTHVAQQRHRRFGSNDVSPRQSRSFLEQHVAFLDAENTVQEIAQPLAASLLVCQVGCGGKGWGVAIRLAAQPPLPGL